MMRTNVGSILGFGQAHMGWWKLVAVVNLEKVWATSNAMVSKQSIAWLAKEDTGALRPEKRPRWKRRQINEWVLRWATRSRVLLGAFKGGERLPLETLRAKAVGHIFVEQNDNRWPKTWPQK